MIFSYYFVVVFFFFERLERRRCTTAHASAVRSLTIYRETFCCLLFFYFFVFLPSSFFICRRLESAFWRAEMRRKFLIHRRDIGGKKKVKDNRMANGLLTFLVVLKTLQRKKLLDASRAM